MAKYGFMIELKVSENEMKQIYRELEGRAPTEENLDKYSRTWRRILERVGEQIQKAEINAEIKVGDEVMTEYAQRAIAVRNTYYVGKDREPFTLIWFGTHMSSCPVNNLTKTGKHYPQIAEIMEELRCAESEEG